MADVVEELTSTERRTSVEVKSDLEESTSSPACLKEHERLDVLLSKIPLKAQTKFLSTCDLILTCIDASTSYIVLGSNIGLIFVFSREDSSLQKIKVTVPNNMITSVKLHEGTDHSVAVGTACGLLCVYCIPSKASPLEKKEIQKFEVKDVHRNYITCLEWSTNGMKLCSGDTKGHVVVTEIDFYEDKCTSMVLLIDAGNEIVQLSYAQKVLAVATVSKSYLVRLDLSGQTVDIEKEDGDKTPGSGRFGVCFIPGMYKTEDVLAYTARQDCGLWLVDVKGNVKSEHSFSFPFSTDVPEIDLYLPKKEVLLEEFQFGRLKMFKDNGVVTWQNSCLVILDPCSDRVVAYQNRFDNIVDVAVVTSGEIFVLQRKTGARVVRIAYKHDAKLGIAFNMSLLTTLLPPNITTTDDKGHSVINDGNFNSMRRSSSITNLAPSTNIRRSSSITNIFSSSTNNSNSGGGGSTGGALSFFKNNFVKPLKKLDPQTNQTTEVRVIQSVNIPDAKIMSDSDPPDPHPSPTAPRADDNTRMALNFIRRNLVEPLKKLDHHINPDTEKVVRIEKIPDSRIPVVVLPPAEVPDKSECDQIRPSQAKKFEHINADYPADEEGGGAIVVIAAGKTKKHKKKKGKKGNHVAPIEEYNKNPGDAADKEEVMVTLLNESKEDDGDKSAMEALRRADKLLNKINHANLAKEKEEREEDKSHPSREFGERITKNTELVKSVESNVEGFENGLISQSVSIEDDVIASVSVSDDSIRLEQSVESFNKFSTSTEHESSCSEQNRLLSDNEVSVSGEDSSNLENEYVNRYGRNIDNDVNERQRLLNVESGIGSSPDSLNDCVERALESLCVSNVTEKEGEEGGDIEGENKEISSIKIVEEVNPLPVTPNSAVQNYVGFFDSVEESPLEDLYGRSVYSVGSADTILYNDPSEVRHSPKPTTLHTNVNSYCAPVGSVKYQFQNLAPQLDINVWSEIKTPTNIYSVSMSDTHAFYTDKTENIYHLMTKENSVSWKKASGKANQISVSPSGHIVWSLHKKVVYVGTKISPKYPEGLKWVENVRNVDCISVDNYSAWYITQGGSVIVETKLCLEQPIGKPRKITCPYKLKYILCRHGVVWAITERLQLLVRSGVTNDCLEGREWRLLASDEPPFMFNHVAIDHKEVGWAVDFLGQLWFCPGVNMENPAGCGRWWQVPLTDSLLHDENTRHLIKEVAQKFDPVKFSHIVSTSRGGLITAGPAGIFLALDFNNIFNVCKGSIQGYQWLTGPPSPLPDSSAWKLLCAGASHTNKGNVWAQHVNKELYAFKQVKGYAKLIDNEHSFICMSANIFTVWGLTSDGWIMNRMGIDDFCPEGTSWQHLDLVQLRDIQIVHLSCSWMYVWAVDINGQVYQRIGAKVDTPNQLNPIWLPIDNFSKIVFTKVFAGPEDWMVWAIDNRRMIYTRDGVQDNQPIGKEWIHVTGIQATEMTLSRTGVWALTPTGELYYRQQITKENICGKHWKKIPGLFTKISASAEDDLWAVTLDGELRQCNTQHVWRTENDLDFFNHDKIRSPSTSKKEDFDWELL